MVEVLLIFWLATAVSVVFVKKTYRVIIAFAVFSLLSSVVYMFLGAPDVAMSEAGISAFAIIFMIVCIEKVYDRRDVFASGDEQDSENEKKRFRRLKRIAAALFALCLGGFALYLAPTGYIATELRDQYLMRFMQDVGGENAVTAIYLGYRVYDTLFEALLLVASVVAVAHMSWYEREDVADGIHSEIETSRMTRFTMRIVTPIILMFGIYLVANGHISAGGGFLGGLAFASFFICRYLVQGIYDLPIKKIMQIEEWVFINITVLPILAIFAGSIFLTEGMPPWAQNAYLIAMSTLVGAKVACSFFVLFYRYVAIERLKEGQDV